MSFPFENGQFQRWYWKINARRKLMKPKTASLPGCKVLAQEGSLPVSPSPSRRYVFS
jgi:hypothetical protein